MRKKSIAIFLCFLFVFQSIASYLMTVSADSGTERKSLQVKKTLTAPKIDGVLDESMWQVSNEINAAYTGTEFDGTKADFGMLWDNTYLYIAADVEETVCDFVYGASGYWFEQDNISMFFDPTNHQSAPYIDSDMQIGLVYQPDNTPEFHFGAALNGHADKDEKQILRAINTDGNNWTCEVAIPWEMLSIDPYLSDSLGFEIVAADRDSDDTLIEQAWCAYDSVSFWNDTSGYGQIILSEQTVNDNTASNVLLDEDFESCNLNTIPDNWISDVNSGSPEFTVVKSVYEGVENNSLVLDGNASGCQARIAAPVQWNNYIVEADISFIEALNDSRWASVMYRVPSNGKNPYNQMALRRNGAWEIAYRDANNNWSVPYKGNWSEGALEYDKPYTMKVRVFDKNVKQYLKQKEDTDFDILAEQTMDSNLLESGKVGFQGDQCKVSFDNLKVTRLIAAGINTDIASSMEALSGPINPNFTVDFSDGISDDSVSAENIRMYSSDESVIIINDGKIYPIKEGNCTIKLVYFEAEKEVDVTVTASSTGVQATSISYPDGYILGTKDTDIDTADIKFNVEYNDFTSGQLDGSQCEWSFEDTSIAQYGNGKIQVLDKGITKATVTKDDSSAALFLFTRETNTDSYILYEEDFDGLSDGDIPEGWTRIEGQTASNIGVNAGAFEIDALSSPDNPTRLLLPEYLNQFGNYTIEMDVTHLQANESTRWNSLMYRIQNDNYPYYQMAVRQNAASHNGVEFAERTPSNGWNVMKTALFTEAIDADKMYHYTIKAYEDRVQELINDTLLIDTDLAGSYLVGGIGVQANGSKMKIDNVRVTMLETPLPKIEKPEDRYARISEPDTKIAMAPSVITEIASAEDFNNVINNGSAATAIMNINKNLEVLSNGNVIGTVDDMYSQMETKVIPAFRVNDQDTVDAIVGYLKDNGIEDTFIISKYPELVKEARAEYSIVRGVIEFENVSEQAENEELMNIRNTTNSNLAKIAVLPRKAATKHNVQYLQQRLITVWTKEEIKDDTDSDLVVTLHSMITAGVNGILTTAPEMAKKALEVYNHNVTIVRKPFLIGHRGVPSLAPENTIEGSVLAFQLGADMVENDIYPTKAGSDGKQHLVIMHDDTIDRTTNGSGNIYDMTLEEVQTYLANSQFPAEYPAAQIPTLDQYFENFTGEDQVIFIEIKSYDPVTIDLLKDKIEEMGVEDHVVAISFSQEQLQRAVQQMPEMSLGYLCSGIVNESDIYGSLRTALTSVQNLNSTFNTSYNGIEKGFMEVSKHRGMTIWPWTYRDKDSIVKYFKLGIYGMTTDNSQMYSDWAASITPIHSNITINNNGAVSLKANIETYAGNIDEVVPDIVVLSGGDNVEINGNKVTAKNTGETYVTLRYTANLTETDTYDIYTQPVKIHIKQDNDNDDEDRDAGSGNDGNNEKTNTDGSTTTYFKTEGKVSTTYGNDAIMNILKALDGNTKACIIQPPEKDVANHEIVLEANAVKTLVSNKQAVGIKVNEAVLEIPGELLEKYKDTDVRVNIKKLQDNQKQQLIPSETKENMKQTGNILDFTIYNGEDEIKSFDSKVVIEMFVDDASQAMVDTRKLGIYYYDEGTNKWVYVGGRYDPVNKKVVAEVNHFTMFSVMEYNPTFNDIQNNWAKDYIEILASKHIIHGYGAEFKPKDDVTRAEFVKMLVTGLEIRSSDYQGRFTDCTEDDWYTGFVEAAADNNIIDEYAAVFRPNDKITREEMAVMVIRAYTSSTGEKVEDFALLGSKAFTDVNDISNSALKYVQAAQYLKIINGMPDGSFKPKNNMLREQSSNVIYQLLNIKNQL